MSLDKANDRIDLGTAAELLDGTRPMATCPVDGEPLIFTFRFRGTEFICMVCGALYGFLAPTPKPCTPELEARLDELQKAFDEKYAQPPDGEGEA